MSDEFKVIGCDTFSPDFKQSSASVLWYKAGQTMLINATNPVSNTVTNKVTEK